MCQQSLRRELTSRQRRKEHSFDSNTLHVYLTPDDTFKGAFRRSFIDHDHVSQPESEHVGEKEAQSARENVAENEYGKKMTSKTDAMDVRLKSPEYEISDSLGKTSSLTKDVEDLIKDLKLEPRKTYDESRERVSVDYEDEQGDKQIEVPKQLRDSECISKACKTLEIHPKDSHLSSYSHDTRNSAFMRIVDVNSHRKRLGKSTLLRAQGSFNALLSEPHVQRCSTSCKLCLCEIQQHQSLDSCWIIVDKNVYDVTSLVKEHPGGANSILKRAGGTDCARDMKFHSKQARKILSKCYIGKLQPCGEVTSTSTDPRVCCIM